MTFHRGPRSSSAINDGQEKGYSTPFTTSFAVPFALRQVGTRNRQQPFSIAKASSQRTSVVPRGTTQQKKVMGRKRHLLVDVLGLILLAVITPASTQDRDGAVPVLEEAHREYPKLERIWVDGAYNGSVIDALRSKTKLDIEVVKRPDKQQGFEVQPRRWVVERTHGWLCKWRILNKEYERTLESSRADVLHAMTGLMLRRLTTALERRRERR
jgi:putative transposase